MNMFKTTGTMDEMTVREAAPHLYGWWWNLPAVCLVAIGLYLSVTRFFAGSLGHAAYCLGITLLGLMPTLLLPRRAARISLRQMQETGAESVDFITWFDEMGVFMENRTQGGAMALPYTALQGLARTKHLLLLRTAARQFVVVFRTQLGAEQERALIEFLKQKPTEIRRWPKIK